MFYYLIFTNKHCTDPVGTPTALLREVACTSHAQNVNMSSALAVVNPSGRDPGMQRSSASF